MTGKNHRSIELPALGFTTVENLTAEKDPVYVGEWGMYWTSDTNGYKADVFIATHPEPDVCYPTIMSVSQHYMCSKRLVKKK